MILSSASAEDILCKVDSGESLQDPLSVTVVEVRENQAYLTIIIPVSLLQSFQTLFESFVDISKYVKRQVHVQNQIARSRSAIRIEEQKLYFKKLCDRVIKKFDTYISSGSNIRKAIRQTKEELKNEGLTTTCYQIELITRQAGRLSKRRIKTDEEKRKKADAVRSG